MSRGALTTDELKYPNELKGQVMDFAAMSNDELTAALTEARDKAKALFALTEPTIEQVDEAEALVASVRDIETEQKTRAAAREDASKRFAAARQTFSAEAEEVKEIEVETEPEAEEGDEGDSEGASDGGEEDNGDSEDAGDEDEGDGEESGAEDGGDSEEGGEAVTTASAGRTPAVKSQKISAARAIGRKTKRPAVKKASPLVITAAADVEGFANGQRIDGMAKLTQAVQARARGFAPYNEAAARSVFQASGGKEQLHRYSVASFALDFDPSMDARRGNDYGAARAALKSHNEMIQATLTASLRGEDPTLTAAGWCAPSPTAYNWIADYVVDGLLTEPEISAPRGGLKTTTGPALAQTTYADVDDFGFGGTEAQAIAGFTGDGAKTCGTIECPDFTDHRLDYSGYCWKIPILTNHAYPELVEDALRLSTVLYAHRMNKRFIGDIVAASSAIDATGYGATFTDTLEALTQVAVKERRWWNVGVHAVMEVKLPQFAEEVFKFDMARRAGLALDDIATSQKVAAHFATHNLAVEYISDYQDLTSASSTVEAEWPEVVNAIMYPSGTFARAVEDVINLSTVYDAASLSENEYTGVFYEQGVMTVQLGYRSHTLAIPVCTAGLTGAADLTCLAGSL